MENGDAAMHATSSLPTPQSLPPTKAPTFTDLFTPKLVTILREGYGLRDLRADALSGLTVAIVALPLSMAIAIASGATPERGLYTAIIGGFLISCFGGSRFQIGGPAAAFTVIVATTISRHGLDGLFLATLMSGAFLTLIGLLRLGSYIKFIPYPVTVGFISGIAIILLVGQVHDLLGLTLVGRDPPDILSKLSAIATSLPTLNPFAVAISLATMAMILGLKRLRPTWPGILIAVILAALAGFAFHLPIATIGSRFGGIPSHLPLPAFPAISLAKLRDVFPDAINFTLLGAVESLLSAMVADGMTGRRHRSNMELVAQGIANMASALFGGLPATGTIARTATNVRSGARGPVSGMLHAVFICLFMLIAAPLASYVPLAALAGVLVVVAWNMAEKHAIITLVRTSWGDTLVLLVTLGLTVFRSLSEAILIGFSLGALLFIHRMSTATGVSAHVPAVPDDIADTIGPRTPYDASLAADPDVAVYRITGAVFFGAAGTIGAVLDSIADRHKAFILDVGAVPFIDSTAANAIAGVIHNARRHGTSVLISGASNDIGRALDAHGITTSVARRYDTLDHAVIAAHAQIKTASTMMPNP